MTLRCPCSPIWTITLSISQPSQIMRNLLKIKRQFSWTWLGWICFPTATTSSRHQETRSCIRNSKQPLGNKWQISTWTSVWMQRSTSTSILQISSCSRLRHAPRLNRTRLPRRRRKEARWSSSRWQSNQLMTTLMRISTKWVPNSHLNHHGSTTIRYNCQWCPRSVFCPMALDSLTHSLKRNWRRRQRRVAPRSPWLRTNKNYSLRR